MSAPTTIGPDGLVTAPERLELRSGCVRCSQHGPHLGAHVTVTEHVGQTIGDWLEDHGYAAPANGELGTVALRAVVLAVAP